MITLLKIHTFDKSDHRPLSDTIFVNFDIRKQVKIDFSTKKVSLTNLRTIVLNTLGLKDSSSFVLSFRGKTLPLGDTLISDPSIGLLSYSTVNLFSEHLIGGGNICSDQKIEDDKRIPVKIGRSSPVNIGPTSPVSSGEEEYKVVLSEPAIHEPEPSRISA